MENESGDAEVGLEFWWRESTITGRVLQVSMSANTASHELFLTQLVKAMQNIHDKNTVFAVAQLDDSGERLKLCCLGNRSLLLEDEE